jgi:hypothetical protein
MKYLSFVSAILLVGCNANQIGVTRLDPQSAMATTPQPGIAQASDSSSDAQPASTIFFEEIRLRDGLAPVVNGVGFLDREAENSDPFIIRLKQEVAISDAPAFTPVSGGILLADGSSSEPTLRFLEMDNLNSTDLFGVPGVVSVASTPSHAAIGWVDAQGNAYFSKNNRSLKLDLGSSSLKAKRIVALDENAEFYVLAQGDSNKVLLFNSDSQTAEQTFDADQIAISPKGNQILVVNGNSVQVYNRSSKTTKILNITATVREASWQNEETISYWTETAGQPELDLLNTNKSNQQTQVTVLDPSMANAGMICPVWNDNNLYFADFRDGKNVILRAVEKSGTWNVSSFSESTDSRFGLICPSVSNYF